MPESEKLTMTVVEAAAALGINEHLLYDLVRQHKVPAIKLGSRRIVIPRRAFEDFLAGRWTPPRNGHDC